MKSDVITRNIPNSITCINLLAGCVAIVMALRGSDMIGGLKAYEWAYIFIGIAAVADFCDGFAARLLKAYSAVGKELDSLCDLISFGVAPAMLMYSTAQECGAPQWLWWCMLVIPVCGALRLARFNVDDRQTTSFIGLPIPANAIFWIGFTTLYRDLYIMSPWFILAVVLLESWLMVSPVKLYSLKFKSWGLRENQQRYWLIFAAILFVSVSGLRGLMWTVLYYLASSIAMNYRERK